MSNYFDAPKCICKQESRMLLRAVNGGMTTYTYFQCGSCMKWTVIDEEELFYEEIKT